MNLRGTITLLKSNYLTALVIAAAGLTSSPAWSEQCGVFGDQSGCTSIIAQDDAIISFYYNSDGTIHWDYSRGSGGGAGGDFSASNGASFADWAHQWVSGGGTGSLWGGGGVEGGGFEGGGSPSPVPEPETYAMMLAGLGLLGVIARRRQPKVVA